MTETIEQIMNKDFYKIEISDSLLKAKETFDRHSIPQLPVISDNKLVGMLNQTDIMSLSFGSNYFSSESDLEAILFKEFSIADIMKEHPRFVSNSEPIEDVGNFLIKEGLQRLPIVDNSTGELVGIISLEAILDFLLKKIKTTNNKRKYVEIRPWGHFEQYCQNTPCTVKILNVKPDEELSLQYHKHRREFWKIIQGEGSIVIGDKEVKTRQGEEFIIPAKTKHQIKTKHSSLQVLEISFGHFDEKDIVRIEDKYNRPANGMNRLVFS